MSNDWNSRIACLGLVFSFLLHGCTKDKPAETPSPSVAATTVASATPSSDATPEARISPLGGQPATEAEIEYYAKKKAAEDLALVGNYTEAIPAFEALHVEAPDDINVTFYLMLSHGSVEGAPSKTSTAFAFAEKVLASAPGSREAAKAQSYINTANLALPPGFKYGTDTMSSRGDWVFEPEATFKATSDIPFHTSMLPRISPDSQTVLWETEASPSTATGAEKLPKGTEVKILSVKEFLYGLTSWRKPLKAEPQKYDKTMFSMQAMYVEVVSEGPLKGKKGWIVDHADRFLDTAEGDQWGVWISNRLKVPRQEDVAATAE